MHFDRPSLPGEEGRWGGARCVSSCIESHNQGQRTSAAHAQGKIRDKSDMGMLFSLAAGKGTGTQISHKNLSHMANGKALAE